MQRYGLPNPAVVAPVTTVVALAAIEAEGLVKVYRSRKSEVRALDGVDLEVREGTVLGLLGPNGAGKTTTVRILATLLRADAGRATVAGLDVARDAQAVRKLIGLSGQYAAVDENLTGRENLWMFGRLYQLSSSESSRRANALLERFALEDAADRVAKTYSGGMRRRLDLAAALIGQPQVLFLDEPTTGLDPRSRLAMWDVIRSQVREGNTLLLTTQYLEEADELADEIVVVDHGQIIARGTSDELKSQVGGERIEVVVHDRDQLSRAADVVAPNGSAALDEHSKRLTIAAHGGAQQLVDVVRSLGDAGIALDDVALRRPTLDDVFLALTGHAAEELPDRGGRMTALSGAVGDGLVIAWRTLKRVPRIPELAIFAILQSIMFVVLFAFVFGGAIPLPGGGSYREYLMPGIYIQTLAFASITTAIAFADDMTKGIIDRFRSLPMARSGVLSGRTFADVIYTMGILVVLMLSGLVVGWRVHSSVGDFVLAVLLMVFFTYAMAWVGVYLGLVAPTVETVQQLGFLIIFPLTFLSNAFVPTETLPDWLQPIAEWNPISALTQATRELFGNPSPYPSGSFPSEHPFLLSVLWTVAILAVFAPLGVRKYRAIDR